MKDEELTLSCFHYHLPPELIAQEPLPERTSSRLLAVDGDRFQDRVFRQLPDLLRPGDLLVLNDTRVFKARLQGRKASTGGKVEVFLLRETGENLWKAILRPGRSARHGARFIFSNGLGCTVAERLDHGRAMVRFHSSGYTGAKLMESAQVPLPPYIKRDPVEMDDLRYQTVYASSTGAVAAPTAGLHFTPALLEELGGRGIGHTFVTLHVGPGTFQPLRFETLAMNRLEPEEYSISSESLATIRKARNDGGRIVAVGTTSTRILESIDTGSENALSGETEIFIFPPYGFRNVDVLITNFHLPGSSLLCLVAAFMGYDLMMEAYRHAIEESYRFYSYGDAMLIFKERTE
jgi:S-adenosylmethionine:tRNA ribosyltransferase-isomerase